MSTAAEIKAEFPDGSAGEKHIRDAVKEIDGEIGELHRIIERASIRLVELTKVREKLAPKQRSSARGAGPALIATVRSVVAGGPRSQAEVVRQVGRNSGSVSYAIKALVERGEIVATGERVGRSKVYAVAGKGRRVVRPGS